jgi:hypothetical protein
MNDNEKNAMMKDLMNGAQYLGDLKVRHPDVAFSFDGQYFDWEDLKGDMRCAKEMYCEWLLNGTGTYMEWLKDEMSDAMFYLEDYIGPFIGKDDDKLVKDLTSKCVSIIAHGSPWSQVQVFLEKQKKRSEEWE